MRFSVVIAAYEAAETVGDAVGSVLRQSCQDFEVIVVDDGSRDDTAGAACQFGDWRVGVHRQGNAGPSAARNCGIDLARGELVSMLDSDDLWLPGYLSAMDEAMQRNPRAGFAYTDAWALVEPSGRFRRATTAALRGHPPGPTLPREQFIDELLRENFVFNSVTVRRAVLQELGGYEPSLSHAEDYELWLRIVNAGYEVERVPGPLAIWRDRSGSLSDDEGAMLDGLRRVYETVLERQHASPHVQRLAGERLIELRSQSERRARLRVRAIERVKRPIANLTRPMRTRRRMLSSPPAEVAAAFPGLGGAVGNGASAEPVAIGSLDSGLEPGQPVGLGPVLESPTPAHGVSDVDPTEPPKSLTNVVTRGIGLAGAGYGFSQILTFVSYLALARLIAPAAFGHFAAGSVLVGVGIMVGESGMLAALIQREKDVEEALNSAFLATLAGGVALSLLALAASPLVTLFFHSEESGLVAAALSGWMLLRLAAIVPDAVLQRRFSFMRRVIVDPLATIAFAAGAIPTAIAGLGVWSLVIGTYTSALVTTGAPWLFARWRPRPHLASKRMWRELARFGRPVMGANVVRHFVIELPVLALGRVKGPSVLGQYTYSSRVASQPLGAVINAGGYVLLPAFSRLAPHEERFRAALRRALRWLCITAFPAGLMLVGLAVPTVVLVFGHRWHQAGVGAAALGVSCAALSLDSIASEAWKARERPDMLPRLHLLSLLCTAVGVAAGLPFGLVGVTVGISVSSVCVAAYAVRGMSSVLGVALSDLWHEIWPPAVAATVMGGAVLCLDQLVVHAESYGVVAGLILVALQALLGLLLYFALLALLAPHSAQELLGQLRARLA